MAKRRPPDPGTCAVCGRPKQKRGRDCCRECARQVKGLVSLLARVHGPDPVPPRVGAMRWAGRLPLEERR